MDSHAILAIASGLIGAPERLFAQGMDTDRARARRHPLFPGDKAGNLGTALATLTFLRDEAHGLILPTIDERRAMGMAIIAPGSSIVPLTKGPFCAIFIGQSKYVPIRKETG
jgi:hypothetical protein